MTEGLRFSSRPNTDYKSEKASWHRQMLEEKDFPVIIPMQKSTRAPAYHFGSSSTKYTTMPKELMSLASGKPEDEQKDLMDRKRQYPTLCKVLSSEPECVKVANVQRYLRTFMPDIYPQDDLSVPQDLYEKRSYLEALLMVPNPEYALALVLKFWGRLGGLKETGESVAEIHFAKPRGNDRRSKNLTASSDRMDIDDVHSSHHTQASSCYQVDATVFRKAGGRSITRSDHYYQSVCRSSNKRASDMDIDDAVPYTRVRPSGSGFKKRKRSIPTRRSQRIANRSASTPNGQANGGSRHGNGAPGLNGDGNGEDPGMNGGGNGDDPNDPDHPWGDLPELDSECDTEDESEPKEGPLYPKCYYHSREAASLDAQRRFFAGEMSPEELEAAQQAGIMFVGDVNPYPAYMERLGLPRTRNNA